MPSSGGVAMMRAARERLAALDAPPLLIAVLPTLLVVAGVGILRSHRSPLLLEVNSSPGLEGIEQSSGKDVAGMVIEYLEKHAQPGKTKDRIQG